MEELDLAVIGAGWAGLAAAKTFSQLNADKSLVIFESAQTLGGVWARERLYPGLKTNNMLGTYEYPDFPMHPHAFAVKPGQHIPGSVCHDYLDKYAHNFAIAHTIRYNSRVTSAEHRRDSAGWLLTVVKLQSTEARCSSATTSTTATTAATTSSTPDASLEQYQVLARKIVVATGLTSDPFRPGFEGESAFAGTIFHVKDLPKHPETLLATEAKRVTVFGGTKSAWDAVYAYATKGIAVDWVIRSSGHGPAWMAPPYVTPLKKWLEKLVMTRLLSWLSPCVWGPADGYPRIRRFLHGTAIGRFITDSFWSTLASDVLALNRYDAHPETAKLKPWSHPMFVASSLSILNYDTDFFDLVRSGVVSVHLADITHLSENKVHLSDGTELDSNVLCCVTGWRWTPPLRFLPQGIEADLGLPQPASSDPLRHLIAQADHEILSRFPRLKSPPPQNKDYVPLIHQKGVVVSSPADAVNAPQSTALGAWTLYRFMVPTSDRLLRHRDIAFAGMLMNFNVPLTMHLQALWINAYFHGDACLRLPEDPRALQYQAVLHSRFGRWRYPAGRGCHFPDFVFDAQPYIDLLVADLGLRVHRKKGLVAELLAPYGPEDYGDIVSEWMCHVQAPHPPTGTSENQSFTDGSCEPVTDG